MGSTSKSWPFHFLLLDAEYSAAVAGSTRKNDVRGIATRGSGEGNLPSAGCQGGGTKKWWVMRSTTDTLQLDAAWCILRRFLFVLSPSYPPWENCIWTKRLQSSRKKMDSQFNF